MIVPVGPSLSRAILNKYAMELRTALHISGRTVSPDTHPWATLPEARKDRWRELAATYLRIFGGSE